jgi:hypothetical protein
MLTTPIASSTLAEGPTNTTEEASTTKKRMRFLSAEEYDLMVLYLQDQKSVIERIPKERRRAWQRLSQNFVFQDNKLYKRLRKNSPTLLEYVEPTKKEAVISAAHKHLKHSGWHRTYSHVSVFKSCSHPYLLKSR